MARIRSIKPEFFTSEQVAECSPTARLLFVGLWCFCDDGGVHPDSPKRIKMEIFPADEIAISKIVEMVEELVSAGLLIRYAADGQGYLKVTGWRHQRIDKPNFRYPSPTVPGTSVEQSPNGRRGIDERSPPESKGEERKGEEGSREDAPAGKYAFVGRIVRLTPRDFAAWQKAYSTIPDLAAELTAIDDKFSKDTPKEWFGTASAWLRTKHERLLAERSSKPRQERKPKAPMAGTPEFDEMYRKAGG